MDAFQSLQSFDLGNNTQGRFHSLPALEKAGVGPISKLPVSIRIVLESVLRNVDGKRVNEKDVRTLANWKAKAPAQVEIPFVVARIVLQDFTGVPLLVDLAAMRSAVSRLGRDAKLIEPLVPVDLVVDHSVQVDFFGTGQALQQNMELEFKRNRERYQLLKWGQQAFNTFGVVPPGIGIVHQVNLEYLAKGILEKDGVYYPDTLVGTDSHTTMINGLGVVGWGVGGIEAEAGMLGQPVYFLTPEVVGVNLTGSVKEGVTATDVVLHITQMLRKAKVVGKFVEFFGEGARSLPVTDRATIGNMAPEYGATMGFFPIDEQTVAYLRETGRSEEHCRAYENYYRAQGLWGMPRAGDIEYSVELALDLGDVVPAVSGPRRPQDRIELTDLKSHFRGLFSKGVPDGGYGKAEGDLSVRHRVHLDSDIAAQAGAGLFSTDSANPEKHMVEGTPRHVLEMVGNRPTATSAQELAEVNGETPYQEADIRIGHGSVLIAAITSCTNTSNPSVMLAAGLLAKRAVEKGLRVDPSVKTSLGPGSRVVSDYLEKTGLQPYLDQLGFQVVGFGCTTCIGNSGPLHPKIEEVIAANDLVAASVLSGNRNFEARVHQSIKANFLMSPPLVVAFALAGKVDIDFATDPIGRGRDGQPVYLREVWPSLQEVKDVLSSALSPETFQRLYSDFAAQNPLWNEIPSSTGDIYEWDEHSTYIQEPPFFQNFSMEPAAVTEIKNARALGVFGDSVTTDHISPAGAIKRASPAGHYLLEHGVEYEDFNSYGSRRGNDRVMTRGTFANVRIKNLMVPGVEGGVTKHQPEGEVMPIHDASLKYQSAGIPLVIFAGQEYGTGSSRDWAAKGTKLLGVRAVVAQSYERIHRSNLVGMGILPLQFPEGITAQTLKLDGTETFDFVGLGNPPQPMGAVTLVIHRADGSEEQIELKSRIDTAIEVDYYQHGGILPYVLRQLLAA
jgi:aconitate hydratase